MSKFLKFIVHFAVICTILCVLALVVPPFAGISTTVIDKPGTKSNLAFGSVTYAREVDGGQASVGDSVIIKDSQGVYLYQITEIDTEENICKVKTVGDSAAEEKSIALKDSIPKTFFTVPALGFLLVAVQRVEGLIIIVLAVIFLIILYILAELWKKEPKKNEDESPLEELVAAPDPDHVKTKKELKMEEKERVRRLKEEDKRIRAEEKARRKARKQLIRSGGFIDDVEEELPLEEIPSLEAEEPVDLAEETPAPVAEETAAEESEAPKVSQDTIVMPPLSEKTAESVKAEGEAPQEAVAEPSLEEPAEEEPLALEEPVLEETAKPEAPELIEDEEIEKAEVEEEPRPVPPKEIKKIAIPLYTAQQLLQKSREAGEEPEVIQDEMTGVTLLDYSDILLGEDS